MQHLHHETDEVLDASRLEAQLKSIKEEVGAEENEAKQQNV
jgi:hypothetical protein